MSDDSGDSEDSEEYPFDQRLRMWRESIRKKMEKNASPSRNDMNIPRRNAINYQEYYERQFEQHRLNFAPHSVRISGTTANVVDSATSNVAAREDLDFRRRVYSQNMWVIADEEEVEVSQAFFSQRRLAQWLNRELSVLVHNSRVTFMSKLILALTDRYKIKSQEFEILIRPYLNENTRHFIHEYFHYTNSRSDMCEYDMNSRYRTIEIFTIEDDDEVGIVVDSTATNTSSPRSREVKVPVLRKIICNNVPKGGRRPEIVEPSRQRAPEIVYLSSDEEITTTGIDDSSFGSRPPLCFSGDASPPSFSVALQPSTSYTTHTSGPNKKHDSSHPPSPEKCKGGKKLRKDSINSDSDSLIN